MPLVLDLHRGESSLINGPELRWLIMPKIQFHGPRAASVRETDHILWRSGYASNTAVLCLYRRVYTGASEQRDQALDAACVLVKAGQYCATNCNRNISALVIKGRQVVWNIKLVPTRHGPRLTTRRLAKPAAWATAATLIALTWAGTLGAMHAQHQEAQARVESQLANQALAFEDQLYRQFLALDQTLRILETQWEKDSQHFDLIAWHQQAVVFSDLSLHIFVTDANGVIRASTRPDLIGVNVASRDYFRHEASLPADDDRMFIGRSTRGLVTQQWQMNMARRLDHMGGGFGGVIGLSYDTAALTRFYRDADMGSLGMIALVGMEDGQLRALAGPHSTKLGTSIVDSELYAAILATTEGRWVGPSPTDGILRIHAFRRVQNQSLSVLVGLDLNEAMRESASWANGARVFATGITLLILSATIYLLRAMRSAWKREERLANEHAALEASNLQLEAAKRELEHASARALFLAAHDSLTGLPNRRLLNERLREATKNAGTDNAGFAVLCVDLDGFKAVNDVRGHLVGDALLVQVAERLRGLVRDSDIVARVGGDEFIIIQTMVDEPSAASKLARRVVDRLATSYLVEGCQVQAGASVGVALCPAHGSCPDELLRNADLALYRAKEGGRNRFRLFEPAMEIRLDEDRLIEQDLRIAIGSDQLRIFYQPIYDRQNMALVRFEALVRWKRPDCGDIAPGIFIPIAERSDLIIKLGSWVIKTACAEAARWPESIRLSVNLSPVQLLQPDFVHFVTGILQSIGFPPNRLELEVTEGIFLQNTSEVLDIMRSLKKLGVTIALDDFGTGYASLSSLRQFPFDTLKIDKSFLSLSDGGCEAYAIVNAILSLADSLGLAVVAEGIENKAQLEWLQRSGCDELQGFLLGRPMPPDSVRTLLSEICHPISLPQSPPVVEKRRVSLNLITS